MAATAAALIRNTRREAGLTQAQLAERMGAKQSVVARLEGRNSNPTLETLERALEAMGRELALEAVERPSNVDETLIAGNLRLTPAERLATFETSYSNLRELARQFRGASLG